MNMSQIIAARLCLLYLVVFAAIFSYLWSVYAALVAYLIAGGVSFYFWNDASPRKEERSDPLGKLIMLIALMAFGFFVLVSVAFTEPSEPG